MKKGGIAIVVIIGVVLLALLGCGIGGYFVYNRFVKKEVTENLAEKIVEEAIENETGDDVNVNIEGTNGEESVHISDGDNSVDVSSGEDWPDDMPSYVPEFKYGTLTVKTKISGDTSGEYGWSMVYESVDSDALEKYKNDLEKSGWSIETTIDTGEGKVVGASKGEDIMTLSINSTTKIASISVSLKK
ncbi:MAG: hypothetical protein ABIE03_07410 [Patescibacteria group bacterium]|nr:hypothetical protein [Patescibacteria group bacterium]